MIGEYLDFECFWSSPSKKDNSWTNHGMESIVIDLLQQYQKNLFQVQQEIFETRE